MKRIFCGQNCSGRLGEKKAIISVAGAEKDYNFAKLIKELNLRSIKKELNDKNFAKALNLSKEYDIKISLVIINTEQFNNWKKRLLNYPNWFAKLYGIICYSALIPLSEEETFLQMDREYDENTLNISSRILLQLINKKCEVYIRKENEYPSNRIIVADLFARGYFRGFECNSLILNKQMDIENEIKRIFKNR